jgi:hypothetical protein
MTRVPISRGRRGLEAGEHPTRFLIAAARPGVLACFIVTASRGGHGAIE